MQALGAEWGSLYLVGYALTICYWCRILGVSANELRDSFKQEAFESLKQPSLFARNFLEYCCFRALSLSVGVTGHLADKKFRRLTFDMMVVWEIPAVASQAPLSVRLLFLIYSAFPIRSCSLSSFSFEIGRRRCNSKFRSLLTDRTSNSYNSWCDHMWKSVRNAYFIYGWSASVLCLWQVFIWPWEVNFLSFAAELLCLELFCRHFLMSILFVEP